MTPKQQKFIAEYLIDLNATQATIRAGYAAKTADREGSRLLSKANIAARIAEGKDRQLASAEPSAARVLEELRRLAFVDMRARSSTRPVTSRQSASSRRIRARRWRVSR